MNTFILIMHGHSIPNNAGDLLKGLGPVKHSKVLERYMVQAENGMQDGWLAIQPSLQVANDYGPEALAQICILVPNPVFYIVEGRDTTTNFANDFVLGLDDRWNAWIDNDHGLLDRVARVQELIKSGVDWMHFRV